MILVGTDHWSLRFLDGWISPLDTSTAGRHVTLACTWEPFWVGVRSWKSSFHVDRFILIKCCELVITGENNKLQSKSSQFFLHLHSSKGDKGSTEHPTLGRHGSLAAANPRGQQRLEPLEIMELSDFNLFNDNSWTLEILHTPKTILKKTELQQHFHLHKWM